MVLILDGNLEHAAHAGRKIAIFGGKKSELRLLSIQLNALAYQIYYKLPYNISTMDPLWAKILRRTFSIASMIVGVFRVQPPPPKSFFTNVYRCSGGGGQKDTILRHVTLVFCMKLCHILCPFVIFSTVPSLKKNIGSHPHPQHHTFLHNIYPCMITKCVMAII